MSDFDSPEMIKALAADEAKLRAMGAYDTQQQTKPVMNDTRYLITDPVEKVVADALHDMDYTLEGENGQRIDFMVGNVAIECKRMHSDRVIEQVKKHDNYIIVCGIEAAKLFAQLKQSPIGEWMPIENSPKDGTVILGYAQSYTLSPSYCGIIFYNEQKEWELMDYRGYRMEIGFYPTYWMPLPLPPKNK